jgi:hypothetical protein
MKTGRKEAFVFRGVKQTLKRYERDARYAQELRRIAKDFMDDKLIVHVAESTVENPKTAERFLKKLAHTPVVLFTFFVKRGQHPAVELTHRMKQNTNFAKFVMFQAAPAHAKGQLDLRCLPKHRKVIRTALRDLWQQQAADHNGWQSFGYRTSLFTGERTLMKISEADARDHKVHLQNSGTDFTVLNRLGYRSDITHEAAAKLDAIDPLKREIFGGWVSVGVEDATAIRENRSVTSDKSNHSEATSDPYLPFWEDEDAWYDTSLRLVTPRDEVERQANKNLLRKIRELDVTPYLGDKTVADFVPPLAKQNYGRGGAGYWETHLKDRNGEPLAVRAIQAVPEHDGPRWKADAPSDRWLAERKAQRVIDEEQEAERISRQALLDADDAEVRDHSETDVPETILTLLEQQVKETKRKTPQGVIGALASARLEMQRNTARIAQHMSGLTALENAAVPARV